MNIFCLSNHLILDAEVCPKCGWQRPPAGEIGQPVWPPVDLRSGLGGEGLDQAAGLACVEGVLIAPLRSNELVGLSLQDGSQHWRDALPVGLQVVSLAQDGERVLVALRDSRSLMEGCEKGSLQALNPGTGRMSLFWESPGHDLTTPLLLKDRILIRTSESAVYALDRQNPERVLWRTPVNTWWAKEMLLHKDVVVAADGRAMFGEGYLRALRISDGREIWQCKLAGGLPGKQLAEDGQHIYVVDGKKDLLILDGSSGQSVAKKTYLRIYSPPCAGDKYVYLVVRGNQDAQAEDHYLLLALQPGTGEVVWQAPLSERVSLAPVLSEGLVLLGGEQGSLFAFQAEDGRKLWHYPLGSKQDPVHTCLLVCGDQVAAGLYFGQLAVLALRERSRQLQDAQVYLANEDWTLAAAAYALAGSYEAAADVYADRLGEPKKALQLLEEGGLHARAARLAFSRQMYSEALENYRKAGDLTGQAETLLAMGDEEGAAELFIQLGDPKRAAKLMEEAGKLRLAMQIYQEAGQIKEASRLFIKVGLTRPSDVEEARRLGKFDAAAQYEMENGLYSEAARDYQQANMPVEELQALKRAVSAGKVETWVWQRMAELGERMGALETAAEAWLKLERPEKAGTAFQQAAETLIAGASKDENSIAALFEKAVEAFNLGGYQKEEIACLEQVHRYRHFARVVIKSVETEEGFREGEWNCLTLVVKNVGYGLAHKVIFKIGVERFEVESESGEFGFNLAENVERTQMVQLKPKSGHVGNVPLQISWEWMSRGESFEDQGSIPVKVAYKEEPKSAPPVIYQVGNVETWVQGQQTQVGGDFVAEGAQKGDKVEINKGVIAQEKQGLIEQFDLNGDKNMINVQGDYLTEGAQKGDRVEVNRYIDEIFPDWEFGSDSQKGDRVVVNRYTGDGKSEVKVTDSEEMPISTCAHCGKDILPDAKACVYCGKPVVGERTIGKSDD